MQFIPPLYIETFDRLTLSTASSSLCVGEVRQADRGDLGGGATHHAVDAVAVRKKESLDGKRERFKISRITSVDFNGSQKWILTSIPSQLYD